MVASASSSNTQWPSARCCLSSAARRARAIARVDGDRRAVSTAEARSAGRPWRVDYTAVRAPAPSRGGRSPERSAPSMVAGRPVSVQSPARNRLRQRGRGAGPLARPARAWRRRWRGFSLTICQGGRSAADPSDLARHRAQSVSASSSRSLSTQASAPLTVTEMRSGKAKIHSAVPADHARSSAGAPGGGAMRKWRVDDGAEVVGRGQAGHQLAGHPGRHRQDHRVVGGDRGIVASAKSSAGDAAVRRTRAAQPLAEAHRRAVARPDRPAPDRRRRRPGSGGRCAGDRPARPWPGSRAPPRRPGPAEPSSGSVFSAASRNGLHQPVPDRALARDHLVDAPVRAGAAAGQPGAR